jgi:hypothetical protein
VRAWCMFQLQLERVSEHSASCVTLMTTHKAERISGLTRVDAATS